jgi:predicted secreted protein
MAGITDAEYADMHFMYNFCEETATAVSREILLETISRVIDGGTHNVQNKEEVLHVLHVNPSTDTHWDAYKTNLSKRAAWHTLHEKQ